MVDRHHQPAWTTSMPGRDPDPPPEREWDASAVERAEREDEAAFADMSKRLREAERLIIHWRGEALRMLRRAEEAETLTGKLGAQVVELKGDLDRLSRELEHARRLT